MPESMREMLDRELECETLFDCVHGLSELDCAVFEALSTAEEPLSVDEVAERMSRERTTAYRSLGRLEEVGIIIQNQRSLPEGGYRHVYRPEDPDVVANRMQRLLNDWYATVGSLIGELRQKYETDTRAESPAIEHSS